MALAEPKDLARLQAFITTYFNDTELRDLCVLMGVDYHDLGGEGRAARSRELVLFCNRHGRTATLLQYCCELRPHACAEINRFIAASSSKKASTEAVTPAPSAAEQVTIGSPPGMIESTPTRRVSARTFWLVAAAVLLLTSIALLRIPGILFPSPEQPTSALSPSNTPQATGSAPPAIQPLVGTWRVSHQDQHGSSLEQWKITVRNGELAVEAFQEAVPGVPLPGDYHEQLELSDTRYESGILHFTTKRSPSVTTEYALTVQSADRIEGTYTTVDQTLRDIGALQGESGIIEYSGVVIMTRQAATSP